MKGTIICYGDSNTYGYDPRSLMGDCYPEDFRWTSILERSSGWTAENHGVNGRCIPHDPSRLRFVCEQMKDWEKRQAPVWLWIMLGTNDLLTEKKYTAEDTARRMKAFLEVLTEQPSVKDGRIQLRLISAPPMQYGAWVDEERLIGESIQLEEQYKRIAKELGITFTGTGSWNISLAYDGVHFSEEGHQSFADRLLGEMIWQKE